MKRIYTITQSPIGSKIVDKLMAARATLFAGSRYECPCCGWSLRAFTRGGSSWRSRPKGYCPRCNSKPRHRWLWLHLKQHQPDLFSSKLRLLHISPAHGTAYAFRSLTNLVYISGDLNHRPTSQMRMDLTGSPFASDTFDVIICIHVLEHVVCDSYAISELFRVLKPGGWVMVAVPIRMDAKTFEDPAVTDPAERQRLFGEPDHLRLYGFDLRDSLQTAGFDVQTFQANELEPAILERCGLKAEEVMFKCVKTAVITDHTPNVADTKR